ncbi:DUF4422 domain-containing protein [Martelella soudanensis]|uniref:DUF4422 domain-containing protein n=1 Tax=unclassified Martelella TaxID=2629616 RepID=UPI0015DEA932|nr:MULTISPECIES: DUF4422 domain-containing protein [unclassified Martelella]
MKNIFISVVYFKAAPLIKTQYLKPVQAGRALGRYAFPEVIGDDTGVNISEKNVSWNELTVLYWMRHNVDAEFYGLMHYRRLLVFAEKPPKRLAFSEVTEREIERYGWKDDLIEKACEGADILTPQTRDIYLPGLPEVLMSAGEFYAHQHHGEDMEIVEAIVKERSPHIYPYLVAALTGRRIFFNSVTVMRKRYFEEYADWLIDILEQAEKQIDTSAYDSHQRRLCGFLSEYLTYAYTLYAHAVHGAKVKELPMTWGTRPRPPVAPDEVLGEAREKRARTSSAPSAPDAKPINIVLALDKNYVPHGAVTMLSALETTAVPSRLRFFILNGGGVDEESRTKLADLVSAKGASLTFIDIDEKALRWLPLKRNYLTIAAYYRMVMHRYLPDDVGKAIYLDADTVVVDPIETLWNIDLEGHPVAGAPDDAGFHQGRRIQLSSDHRYFNSGVMVFDVAQLRTMNIEDRVLGALRRRGAWIVSEDQDLLNILFENDTKILPLSWNAGTRIYRANPLEPSYSEEEAYEAARAPSIVHFTDVKKPWHTKCTHPFTELYWDYRNLTPWAETAGATRKRRLIQKARRLLRARDRRFERNVAS